MNQEELIKKLEPQLKFLANTKIRGLDREDVKQELIIMILQDIKKHPKYLEPTYLEGWWFKRLKWYLMNLREKEHRDPINRSLSYDAFDGKRKNNA